MVRIQNKKLPTLRLHGGKLRIKRGGIVALPDHFLEDPVVKRLLAKGHLVLVSRDAPKPSPAPVKKAEALPPEPAPAPVQDVVEVVAVEVKPEPEPVVEVAPEPEPKPEPRAKRSRRSKKTEEPAAE
jgi:hypothetical protein